MRDKPHPHLHVAPAPAPGEPGNVVEESSVTDEPPMQPPESDELLVLRRARAPGGGEYQARPEGLFFTRDDVELCISNFRADLVRRSRRRDRTDLVLRVAIGDIERELVLSSARYESLRWIVDSIPGGVLSPVPQARARLLAAIALLSTPPEIQVVEHLGWLRDARDRWIYAHAGGAIGSEGHVALDVSVGAPLDRFMLPTAAEVDATAPLDLLGLAPDRIMVPLLACVVRAVLGDVRFAVHVWGTTGAGKSQLAAIAQSFWGSAMATGSDLPCSWSSTANSNELVLYAAKAALVVVDDWLPQAVPEEQVDRLVRAAGNSAGRARMGAPARPPRGLVVSTGEALPVRVASLIARMLTIRVDRGDVDWARLTVAQQAARDGVHAAWLARFVRWVAPQLDQLRRRLDQFVAGDRNRWSSFNVHARTVDALADLAASWRILAAYLRDAGDMALADVEALVRRGETAFVEVAREQERVQLGGDPVRLFLTVLRDLVEQGVVAIARSVHEAGMESAVPLVGWMRPGEVLLDAGAALAAVQDHLRERGAVLDLSEQQLGRLLRQAGHLVRVDSRGAKVRFGVRATVAGSRRRVLVLRGDALGIGEPSGPA